MPPDGKAAPGRERLFPATSPNRTLTPCSSVAVRAGHGQKETKKPPRWAAPLFVRCTNQSSTHYSGSHGESRQRDVVGLMPASR